MQELVFDLARDADRVLRPFRPVRRAAARAVPAACANCGRVRDAEGGGGPAEREGGRCSGSPYYGWVVERLTRRSGRNIGRGGAGGAALRAESRPRLDGRGEFLDQPRRAGGGPSSPELRRGRHARWEQSAAYFIDTHPAVEAFVKNSGLGFAIPYLDNGEPHDYVPDFLIRLRGEGRRHVILETKGYDPLEEVKASAARRWVDAVNADGRYGRWDYRVARSPSEVRGVLDSYRAGSREYKAN